MSPARARRAVIVVTAVLLLPGCAKYYYGKPAGTYSDFRDDSIACARDVGIPSGNGQYAAVSPNLYRRCMVAKGWEREKRVEPDPYRWFRDVEDNDPIDLAAGPQQPSGSSGPASASRTIICRQTYLENTGGDWRNRLPQYQECLRR